VALFVEFSLYRNEGFSAMCEPSSFCLVRRQHVTEEVVEVECSLVVQRVSLCRWILFKLHDLKTRRNVGWSAPEPDLGGPSSACFDPSQRTEGLCWSLAKTPVGTGSRPDAAFVSASSASLRRLRM